MRGLALSLFLAGAAWSVDVPWQLTKARQSMEDGRLDRAWSRYLKTEALALQQGDRSSWILARCQRTELLLLSEEFAAADSLRPRLSLLGELAADSARIRLTAARVLLAQNRPELALGEAWQARLNARSADLPELEAASWLALARSEFQTGKASEALHSLVEARDLADGQPHLVAQGHLEEARQNLSNPAKALGLVRKAREGFRRARWPSGLVRCLELEATLLAGMGREDAAQEAWQELADLAGRLGLETTRNRAQGRLGVKR
jgi:tetratricopeptide (TPR) repeat protein